MKPVKKPVQAAKRPAENAPKTPVPAKKAKSNTPQKSGLVFLKFLKSVKYVFLIYFIMFTY